jgi:putative cardiolipin synthase
VLRVALACLALVVAGCASIDLKRVEREPTTAPADTSGTRLARAVAADPQARPGESGFVTLERGLDAFVARAALADLAERTLDLQYYIVHGDTSGRLLLGRAFAAAERGVRVRLLIDDWTLADADDALAQLDAHPSVEVRVFNPVANRSWYNPARWVEMLGEFGRINRRMHNKAWIADGVAGIVGGRNLGDEYFEARDDLDYRDLDLLAVGAVVPQMSASFDAYWNSGFAVPVARFRRVDTDPGQRATVRRWFEHDAARPEAAPYLESLSGSALAGALRDATLHFVWGPAQLFADDPAKLALPADDPSLRAERRGLLLAGQLDALAPRPRRELLVVAPYFVPGEAGVAAFGALVREGVRVRVLTNSLASNDVLATQAGYARYRDDLLRAGVELHELKAAAGSRDGRARTRYAPGAGSRAALHEKSFVIDREVVFVGSLNLDPRSVRLNSEVGVLVRSPALAGEVAAIFERNAAPDRAWRLAWVDGREVWIGEHEGRELRLDTEPDAGPWRRLMQSVYGLFVPESLL